MAGIKICGLRREEDIDYVNELMPDYIGYVFWEKSRRWIKKEEAAVLTRRLKQNIVPVGVFVDAPPEFAAELAAEGIIRAIQLHGHEDEAYADRLRELTDTPVIKAFQVRSAADIERANTFPADWVLLDNGYGTGQTFDWTYLKAADRPYFLAGGLDAANVGQILSTVKPYAVDVSSGVETDGYKDYEKIKAFIEAVRRED